MIQLMHNTDRARILHGVLYRRFVKFIITHQPLLEPFADTIVDGYLKRFYCGDPSIMILILMDDGSFTLTGHALIEVQQLDMLRLVNVRQLEYDGKHPYKVADFMKYLDDLVIQVGAVGSSIEVTKHVKVYTQRYGFSQVSTLLFKASATLDEAVTPEEDA